MRPALIWQTITVGENREKSSPTDNVQYSSLLFNIDKHIDFADTAPIEIL